MSIKRLSVHYYNNIKIINTQEKTITHYTNTKINNTKMNAVTSLFAFNDNTKSQQQSQVARSALLLARRLGKISVRINYTVSHQAIMCEFFLPNLAGLVTLQLSWLGELHRARLQKKKKKREKNCSVDERRGAQDT